MTESNEKSRVKYPKKINVRVEQEIYDWYKHFADMENITVSQLIRKIPELYDKMDNEIDKLMGMLKNK